MRKQICVSEEITNRIEAGEIRYVSDLAGALYAAGLTQQQIADALGYSRYCVAEWVKCEPERRAAIARRKVWKQHSEAVKRSRRKIRKGEVSAPTGQEIRQLQYVMCRARADDRARAVDGSFRPEAPGDA